MPVVTFFDVEGKQLTDDAKIQDIAVSEYRLSIQEGINFKAHPAFNPVLMPSLPTTWDGESLNTLEATTRVLSSDDFIYQIKRLADPSTQSPIAGLMKNYIVGFDAFMQAQALLQQQQPNMNKVERLQSTKLLGVTKIDDTHFTIKIKGKYPQFIYWLAMPFFAPMPWEADAFYAHKELIKKNMTLDWFPVGTGPYWLKENNPNRRIVLEKNPDFHAEFYPSEASAELSASGLLSDAGRRLPLTDKVIFSLEKESIPYWNKFLQGYYDVSGISSDSFDQAVSFSTGGHIALTDDMQQRGIQLQTAVTTSSYYFGFNMLDKVVGGVSEKARHLRQAISIAVDYEEYISIFQNGRGVPAQGIIPPGIFGHIAGEQGFNPVVYRWENGAKRRSIKDALKLLEKAGYPSGRQAETGEPLVLYFDTMDSGPDSKARLNWLRKQFKKLNIELVVRATDYNRFQEKMRNGSAQMFMWGWNADYPDPENFLFLLYGNNAKVMYGGENAANYQNEQFDRLFEQMSSMDNSAERQKIIEQMMRISRHDAPWLWGFHPKAFSLQHRWYKNATPNLMANNKTKYIRVDPLERAGYQAKWNKPVLWPLVLGVIILLALLIPAVVSYRKIDRATAR
jgi:ABC-type transport system substrate-binding protein